MLHALYQSLIAPLEPILQGAKQVLVVADGPLYTLPLELLVSAYGDAERQTFRQARRTADGSAARPFLGEYATLSYLADRYRFTYLPSLAALASQRHYPKPRLPVTRQLVAFADPVFGPEAPKPRQAAEVAPSRGHSPSTQATLRLLARSGTNTDLARLPETAEEARAIAKLVGARNRLYLRDQAQEHTIKRLAQGGELQGLRYLLFATHGLLGDDGLPAEPPSERDAPKPTKPLERRAQPALALTLVGELRQEDGLLTMSEVIDSLPLNTDLVVLSACNTAGNRHSSQGEGFAGLTRAFLYAGARHLLVSHWAVESRATRDLMTATFRQINSGAEPLAALTQARRQIRASRQDHFSRAHPYFWAPFVLVGD